MTVTVKLNSGKSISVSRAADGAGLLMTVKTPFGAFPEYLNTDQAGAILFAIEQALTEIDVSREQLAERFAAH